MDAQSVVYLPIVSRKEPVHHHVRTKAQKPLPVVDKKRPLRLLDLPVDILQLIVSHTHDLAALARTHSALYRLAIPHIYSRFDIVWPVPGLPETDSTSVDALTYGLSTLCVGSAFARTVSRLTRPDAPPSSKLLEADYAQYTRKFSLGNGPDEWVEEYAVYKESGKMLGTLVAAAVAKMKNLESFIWDMPTGVLSRVFEALASLAHQPDNECKLTTVWVRWHDNTLRPGVQRDAALIAHGTASSRIPHGSQLTSVGIRLPAGMIHPPPPPPFRRYSDYPCEYPTFSILPPLKSLAVLDIDEIGYLDEMAILIERSKDVLQELRVGISPSGARKDFAQAWDGPIIKQVDHQARWPGGSTIGRRRLGGVLGVLVGRIYDIRKRHVQEKVAVPDITSVTKQGDKAAAQEDANSQQTPNTGDVPPSKPAGHKRMDGVLKLHTLELDRVALSLHVLRYAFDWSVLTKITLLECPQSDGLWKMLHKLFHPISTGTTAGRSSHGSASEKSSLQYRLVLKSIHTDKTTMSLINLIKETLAPNSLEDLFLHDRRPGHPPLPLDIIFKNAIKRHHASLRRLLIDSSSKFLGDNAHWRQWAIPKSIVLNLTSGRMKNLRELAVSFEYKAWHLFLQRLPNLTKLRSLHIRHLADYPASGYVPQEIAQQAVDIASLRPEVPLRYLGAGPKCFEIVELDGYDDFDDLNDYASDSSASSDEQNLGPLTDPNALANAMMGMQGLEIVEGGGGSGSSAEGVAVDVDLEIPEEEDDEDDGEGDVDDETAAPSGDDGAVSVDMADVDNNVQDGSVLPSPPAAAASELGEVQEQGESDQEEEEEEEQQGADFEEPLIAMPPPAVPDPPVNAGNAGSDEVVAPKGVGHDNDNNVEENGEDEDEEEFVDPGRAGVRLKLREVLFYEDKVAIFRARHGRL
ncbi:hypothetical protein VTJ49DRAFT_7317 [Mycothermus thermophilus]|uniref:F-box domain-containing protein n=1 Tax=Humicola insolens TaxID=85995 RepID=A0ABR3VIA7_HUMIN